MTQDYTPYVQKSFRSMVRDILTDVAENGFTDDSHLYITFQTNRPDVEMPDFVRAKYPTQMTVVLQHQYENLVVEPDYFSVDLSFGGVLSHLKIPYISLTQIADPSVQFGLSLVPIEASVKRPASPAQNADVIDLASLRKSS